jgi:hypothetical protein
MFSGFTDNDPRAANSRNDSILFKHRQNDHAHEFRDIRDQLDLAENLHFPCKYGISATGEVVFFDIEASVAGPIHVVRI